MGPIGSRTDADARTHKTGDSKTPLSPASSRKAAPPVHFRFTQWNGHPEHGSLAAFAGPERHQHGAEDRRSAVPDRLAACRKT